MAGITTPFTTPTFPFLQTVTQRALDTVNPAFVLRNGPSVARLEPTPLAGLGLGVFSVDSTLGSGYVQQWNVSCPESLLRHHPAVLVARRPDDPRGATARAVSPVHDRQPVSQQCRQYALSWADGKAGAADARLAMVHTGAFAVAPQFTPGSASRNPVRGPGYRNVDVSASRRLPLRGGTALELRVEAFNVLNNPAFGNPNGVLRVRELRLDYHRRRSPCRAGGGEVRLLTRISDQAQQVDEQQAFSTTTGLRARMNALMKRPSTCSAMSSSCSPASARNCRASDAR